MVILGLVLILIGWLAGIGILETLGIIAVVIGLILWFVPMGSSPRRRYY